MKTAFGSVIYPGALSYLKDFFKSLKNQQNQNFDIILINDGISSSVLLKEFNEYFEFFQQRLKMTETGMRGGEPYQLRIELLHQVKGLAYDLFILGDCDDIFPVHRVGNIIKQYDKRYTFFYNELLDFSNRHVMPELPEITEKIEQIMEFNYLGLTNTALNMNNIKTEFIESLGQGQTNIFDWYLFSRILLNGGTGKRVKDTFTYYRIYDDNIAGMSNGSKEDLEKERAVKIKHYQMLQDYDERYKALLEKYKNVGVQPNGHAERCFWWGRLK